MFTRNSVRPVITIFMLCCFIGVAAESTAADRRSVYDRIDKNGAARVIDPIFDPCLSGYHPHPQHLGCADGNFQEIRA